MSERSDRALVVEALNEAGLHAVSVENPCWPGTPDVNFVGGWIELKQEDHWPKRPATVVRLHHELGREQIIWHAKREAAGGKVWVIVHVERDWLLFRSADAARILGNAPRLVLLSAALRHWTSTAAMKAELPGCLT